MGQMMKTEFNVERVCDRVHLCVVDAPDELGPAQIEIKAGCVHVSFPSYQPVVVEAVAHGPAAVTVTKRTKAR